MEKNYVTVNLCTNAQRNPQVLEPSQGLNIIPDINRNMDYIGTAYN